MRKQQQAFGGTKKMLKGGLHCHTTRSDGKCTPEKIVRIYYEKKYDFLAITDHGNYNYRNFVPELSITILPAMECEVEDFEVTKGGYRRLHSVCIGPSREEGNGFEQDEQANPESMHTMEEYQEYLDSIHTKRNLTIYAHPQWSGTPVSYIEKQKGHFAMEIWNSACALENDMDMDAIYWDELLGKGHILYGVASDDAHKEVTCGQG